jgi:sirohydrochlorin ferrochelatase
MYEQQQMGVLMIAHGSRRPEANLDQVKLKNMVESAYPQARFETAYLELTEPTIPQGLDLLIESGVKEIVMFPYFLSMGVHVVDDLEEHRQHYTSQHPDCKFKIAPPLGLHPLMIEIVKERLLTGIES